MRKKVLMQESNINFDDLIVIVGKVKNDSISPKFGPFSLL